MNDRGTGEVVAVVHGALEDMAEGQKRQRLVIGAKIKDAGTGRDVAGEVVMSEHDPLGIAGGARGVDQTGQIAGRNVVPGVPVEARIAVAPGASDLQGMTQRHHVRVRRRRIIETDDLLHVTALAPRLQRV